MISPSENARPHPDDPAIYIDTDGSFWRRVNKTHPERRQWMLRKMETDKDGYLRVKICQRNRVAHREVYRVFVGELIPGMVICHLNGSCTDNRPCNLYQGTQHENIQHKRMHGTWQSCENHPKALPEHSRHKAEQIRAEIATARRSKTGRLCRGERPRIAKSCAVSTRFVSKVMHGGWK